MNNIRIVKLNNVVSSWRIFYDPFESEVSQDNQFVEMRRAIVPLDSDLSPWLLRIGLDRAKILEYRLTTMDIQSALKSYYNDKFDVMVNDPNDTEIVIRIRIKTFDTESDMLSDLKAAKEVLLNDFVVKGVKNIVYASLDSKEEFTTFNHLTQEFEVFEERFISTEGSNLMEIMGMDGVDSSQVMTNNIMEVYETLGIEAARKLMHAEILNVLGSIYVNHRHISLLIDTMTNNGTIISTTRHGVNKTDANVLAKSSFEENVAQLTNAALFSTIDNMKGVSANVMLGQITPMGTGMTNIYMGTEAAPQECVIVDNNVIMNKNGKENKQTNADVLQMLQNTNDMDFDI
jgi:DNA-directed RNA polymerase II subunit RPB1